MISKTNQSSQVSPLVSVIMPAYNAAKTIAKSIESVLAQTYETWELIVIDDGSSDETASITKQFEISDKRIVYVKLSKNGGLPNARNEGCKLAKGEFIAFLDSDDLWHLDKLNMQVSFHLRNPQIEISHTDYVFFDDSKIYKRPLKKYIEPRRIKEGLLYPAICYRNPIGVLTVVLKRSLINEVNFFDKSLKTMEDQDLWVRIAKIGKEFGFIDKVLASYRLSVSGISKQTGKYKKAYKVYIAKILKNENVLPRIMWRHYYRYFGTIYFHKGQFELSSKYFYKSIRLSSFDYTLTNTVIYLLYSELRMLVRVFSQSLGKNKKA